MQIKKRGSYFVSFLLVVLLISLVSANFFDSIEKVLTGKASSGTQEVAVSVQGIYNPSVIFVEDINSGNPVSPLEGNIRPVTFEVRVSDQDGVSNLDDSSVTAQFTGPQSTIRSGNCIWQVDLDATTARYSCTVNLQYYDEEGVNPTPWAVLISAMDQELNTAINNSETFEYSLLKAWDPASTLPSPLTWPSLSPGSSNIASTNDPSNIINTGNYAGNIYIEGYDLEGETDGTPFPVSSFSVASTTGGVPLAECDVGVTAVALGPVDGTNANTLISANPGPSGSNSADIYYCITLVPAVPSQVYSTSVRVPIVTWVISY